MKRFLLLITTFIVIHAVCFSQSPGYRALSGKKIKSSLVRETGPAGGDNAKSISSGSTTITSGNQATANNSVSRELSFRADGDAVELERKITHIKTRITNPFGEMIVDTENPFERPAPMVKLGEKYDFLVKQRPVTRLSNGIYSYTGATKEFSLAWNEFLPYLSLDSALNTIYLSLPAARKPGTSWADSATTDNISIQVQYTILEIKGDTVVVKCEGLNRYTVPKPSNNSISANVYKVQSIFEGTLKTDARSGIIHNATITAITKNRKLVLGQEVDNDIKEDVTVRNTVQ